MSLGEQRLLRTYLGALVCVVALAFFWLRLSPEGGGSTRKESVRWSPSSEDIEIQRSKDRLSLQGFVLGEEDLEFIDFMEEFHLYEARRKMEVSAEEYGDRSHEFRQQVERYVKGHGMERYRQLGLRTGFQFMDSLRAFLAAEGLDGSERQERSGLEEGLFALSGNFLEWARQIALVPTSGMLDDGDQFLVETLFKFRWLRWADRIQPLDVSITRFEKSVVLAFQVDRYQGLVLTRRLELIAELGALVPEYPADRAHVEVLIDSGNFKEAKKYLARRLLEEPGDAGLMTMHRQLFGGIGD
tara:strand:+ start:259 stop:1158 length:900 start_codon:yes stop_codon:yes gene_type:complete